MKFKAGSSGLGVADILTLIFITLKLTGHIDWSWWWILSPIWISFVIVGVLLLLVAAAK